MTDKWMLEPEGSEIAHKNYTLTGMKVLFKRKGRDIKV